MCTHLLVWMCKHIEYIQETGGVAVSGKGKDLERLSLERSGELEKKEDIISFYIFAHLEQ